MDRKEREEIVVLPVFYRVTPQEVRMHENGCYNMAMEEMAAKYGEDSETVKRWRKALYAGGDLIGFCLSQGEDEGNVVQEIVRSVLKILNRVTLEVAKHPVGITSRLEEIKPLLCIASGDADTCMIGIHGPGGVGKTTLSKAVLNEYVGQFDGWCFLSNVREVSEVSSGGLAVLQQTLLRELLGQSSLTVRNVHEGKVLIKERLHDRRVIAVLDDVNEPEQLDALVGNLDWFGNAISTVRCHSRRFRRLRMS
ncbi:hypothetical protein MLD38_030098 [Melastoma candidum]|nr:hypothetical protein MLD38_030098 [Melastoma candidum]